MSVVQLRYFGGWTLQWHHLSSSGFCEVSLTEEQQGESFQRIRSQTECELEEESVYVSVMVELSCSLSPPNHFYHEGSPVWPSEFLIIGLAPHQQSKDQTGTVLTLSLSPLIDLLIKCVVWSQVLFLQSLSDCGYDWGLKCLNGTVRYLPLCSDDIYSRSLLCCAPAPLTAPLSLGHSYVKSRWKQLQAIVSSEKSKNCRP